MERCQHVILNNRHCSSCSHQNTRCNHTTAINNSSAVLCNNHMGGAIDSQGRARHLILDAFPNFFQLRPNETYGPVSGCCSHYQPTPPVSFYLQHGVCVNSPQNMACQGEGRGSHCSNFCGNCGDDLIHVNSAMMSGHGLVNSAPQSSPPDNVMQTANLPYGVMVQDNGSGIDERYLENLEQQRFNGDNNRDDNGACGQLVDTSSQTRNWKEQQTINLSSADNTNVTSTMWSLKDRQTGKTLGEIIAGQEREIHQLKMHKDWALALIDMSKRRCAAAEREAERLRQQLRVLRAEQTGEDWTGLSAYSHHG